PELRNGEHNGTINVFYTPGGDVGEGHGHGHGHGKDKGDKDEVVTADGHVLHGEKAREAEAIRRLAATGQLDTAHMNKHELDKAVKDGIITQQQADQAQGKDSTSNSSNTTPSESHAA